MPNWKESYEYKRIQEILEDYWLSEPEELKVRVRLDFIKANGETQSKCIVWRNPNIPPTEREEKDESSPIKSFVELSQQDRRDILLEDEQAFWNV